MPDIPVTGFVDMILNIFTNCNPEEKKKNILLFMPAVAQCCIVLYSE